MAVPTQVAAALSGATYSQLVYWRSQRAGMEPLLVPEHRDGRVRLYSFRDVIALRTFAYLRERVSLQKIRDAVRTLDRLGDEEHLSAYRLYATDSSVVWADPRGDHIDLVEQPGHLRASVALRDVFNEFRNKVEMTIRPLYRPFDEISVHPEVRGGLPVVRGTRVPYDLVAGLVRDGLPPSAVPEVYPSVHPAGARDAVKMADYVDGVGTAAA